MTPKFLQAECEEILRKLIAKHGFLQPECKDFDLWDNDDAANLVADLIIEINKSDIIQTAHTSHDWGK